MAGTTRLELATSAVTVSNGVGGHLLIPQGTECHFLSSPYCTQIELVPSPVYSRPSLRFLRSASCSSMLAMSRTGDRDVVARKRSNMVCNSTSPGGCSKVQRCERAGHLQSTMASYSHPVSFIRQQKDGSHQPARNTPWSTGWCAGAGGAGVYA
jgi:hypothetical protein